MKRITCQIRQAGADVSNNSLWTSDLQLDVFMSKKALRRPRLFILSLSALISVRLNPISYQLNICITCGEHNITVSNCKCPSLADSDKRTQIVKTDCVTVRISGLQLNPQSADWQCWLVGCEGSISCMSSVAPWTNTGGKTFISREVKDVCCRCCRRASDMHSSCISRLEAQAVAKSKMMIKLCLTQGIQPSDSLRLDFVMSKVNHFVKQDLNFLSSSSAWLLLSKSLGLVAFTVALNDLIEVQMTSLQTHHL